MDGIAVRIEKSQRGGRAALEPGLGERHANDGACDAIEIAEFEDAAATELALADLNFTPARPDAEELSLNLLCSNRDLPEQIPFGGSNSDFSLPNHSIVKRVKLLRKPTPSLRAPAKRGLQWRLISHLTLNHISLAANGENALKEMLTLYNYTDSAAVGRQIQGIVGIDSRPATTRVSNRSYSGFVRGTEIDLSLDET